MAKLFFNEKRRGMNFFRAKIREAKSFLAVKKGRGNILWKEKGGQELILPG